MELAALVLVLVLDSPGAVADALTLRDRWRGRRSRPAEYAPPMPPLRVSLALLAATLLAHWTNERKMSEAITTLDKAAVDVGQYIGERDRDAADREHRLLALTVTLTRLTWVLLVLAAATLAAGVVALFA